MAGGLFEHLFHPADLFNEGFRLALLKFPEIYQLSSTFIGCLIFMTAVHLKQTRVSNFRSAVLSETTRVLKSITAVLSEMTRVLDSITAVPSE